MAIPKIAVYIRKNGNFYAAPKTPDFGAVWGRSDRIAMQWFLNLMEELGIECRSVIRQRFGPPSHESRNMTDEMRT